MILVVAIEHCSIKFGWIISSNDIQFDWTISSNDIIDRIHTINKSQNKWKVLLYSVKIVVASFLTKLKTKTETLRHVCSENAC